MSLYSRTMYSLYLAVAAMLFASAAQARAPLSPDVVSDYDKASLVAQFNLDGAVHYKDSPSIHLTLLQSFDAEFLAMIRRTCALHRMDAVRAAVRSEAVKVAAKNAKLTILPDTATYCLAAVAEAERRSTMVDLYTNLALQEQGYESLYFSKQTELLKNNEAGRTFQAILVAANAGQSAYTSVSGNTRTLPCPLALDAGATWASANPNAKAPVPLTQAEADAIAYQCYNPAVTTIIVKGKAMPASKAGLVVGVALAQRE